MHVHVTGGGGESGPESKVPESRLSDLFKGGLTTVVGILGTDSVSRTPVELLTKINALNRSPMTAYMWTGAYKTLPEVPTVTGTVEKDIAFITPIIGTKTAISDHRSSQEDAAVLRNLVAQARVGGMLGGKAGLVYAHMGDGSAGLAPLLDVVDNTPIPITQMLPTHMGRTQQLVTEGVEWLTRGGAIDVTASSNAPNIIEQYNASVADMSRVSVSSDAYGSIPEYNAQKQLVGYDYARPDRLLAFLRTMVLSRNHDVADVLALMTENPARTLQVPKGRIEVGADADLLVLEPQSLEVVYSVARGMPVLTPECVAKDLFEH
jgi:beta-aspartyl-dipeptidase (metallo-type)